MAHNNNTPPEIAGENAELNVRDELLSPLSSNGSHPSWTDFNDAPDQIDLEGYTSVDLSRIANALGKVTRSGEGFSCLCPAHHDQNPSLHLSLGEQGKLLAFCHARCGFWDIVHAIKGRGLLVKGNDSSSPVPLPLAATQRENPSAVKTEQDWKKQVRIEKLWGESRPASQTPVETYLKARIPSLGEIPDPLRFHPAAYHMEKQSQYRTMIAKVTFWGEDNRIAIHQTFLKDDGTGKAPIDPDKKMLGSIKGGAVQLYEAGEILGVGEGIETSLSFHVLSGIPLWAALSCTNMAPKKEHLKLPPLPLAQKLVIAIDNDSEDQSLNAAKILKQRAESEGREVYIVRPPLDFKDFNDTLKAHWGKDFDARTLIESVDGKNIDFLFGVQFSPHKNSQRNGAGRIQAEEREHLGEIEQSTENSLDQEDDSPQIPEEAYDSVFEEMRSDLEKPAPLECSELALQEKFLDPWERALDLLHNSRKNLFITGAAGTGKSTLLKTFREQTRQNVLVVAPTGTAAENVEGKTIHKAFNFSIPMILKQVRKLSKKERQFYKKIDTLFIDEISMVRADLLDCVDQFLRKNAHSPDCPFGGVRVVMMGDPYQLPPIVKDDEILYLSKQGYATPYFFSAKCYQNIEFVELTKIYRQKDETFIAILNRIRDKSVTEDDLAVLNQRHVSLNAFAQQEGCIYLATTNNKAKEINQLWLDEIESPDFTFTAQFSGNLRESEYPAPYALTLKEGAQVMLLNNDTEGRWVNGTLGKIAEVTDHSVRVTIEGETHLLSLHAWEIGEPYFDGDDLQSRNIRTFQQYPLQLAWAITIHKSQGKTFDCAIIDMGRGAFAGGQTYVALSRCRSLEGMALARPIALRDIRVDARMTDFLNEARMQPPIEELEPLSAVVEEEGNAGGEEKLSPFEASFVPGMDEGNIEYLGSQKEFKRTDTGIYAKITDPKDPFGEESWEWICKPVRVSYLARNDKKSAWGKLLEFKDPDDTLKEFIMLDEMLAGDGVELRKELMSLGLKMNLTRSSKEKLVNYLNSCNPKERSMTSEKIGWVEDNVYLLPNRLYGTSKERHLFRPRFGNPPEYEIKGTLEEWQNEIAKPCEGNSRFMFSILISLASVLLKIMNMPNFGIHLYGMSSAGKTTALRVGNSVVGNKINQWRMTDNAAETFALESNDSVLFLDEINQAEAQAVDRMIYMLANASTKARANQHGIKRDTCMTFGCVFVSDGEIPLDAKLREIKKTSTAGQGVRCVEIKIDAGEGMGIVEQLNGFETPEALINHLNTAWSLYRGTAMDRLLQELVKKDLNQVRERLYAIMNRWKSINLEVFKNDPDGQVKRVSSNLSLVAAAGELCIALKILPWKQGAAMDNCTRILQDWVFHRGGVEAKELTDVVERLRRLIQEEGNARFDISDDTADNVGDKTPKRAGTKKSATIGSEQKWYFCLFRDIMRYEVLKGCDEKVALDYLTRRKILVRNSHGKATKETRVRGMSARVRMYWIDPDALDS